ncbi:Larval cuticle protein A3A [Camponotus japonicus]
MSYKIIGYFATLLALTRAEITGPGAAAVAVSQQPAATVIRAENYNSHPRYSFGYSVADGLTGDNKVQEETRNGDVVEGSYSLIEPDGARRLVSYAADPINGFNAVVQRDPSFTAAAAATVHPIVTPVAVAVRPQTTVSRQFNSASTHVLAANPGLLSLGVGLGVRSGSLYGTQALFANGGIVKVR